jgi:hypothetical protein
VTLGDPSRESGRDDRVGVERKVRPVLLDASDGEDPEREPTFERAELGARERPELDAIQPFSERSQLPASDEVRVCSATHELDVELRHLGLQSANLRDQLHLPLGHGVELLVLCVLGHSFLPGEGHGRESLA